MKKLAFLALLSVFLALPGCASSATREAVEALARDVPLFVDNVAPVVTLDKDELDVFSDLPEKRRKLLRDRYEKIRALGESLKRTAALLEERTR